MTLTIYDFTEISWKMKDFKFQSSFFLSQKKKPLTSIEALLKQSLFPHYSIPLSLSQMFLISYFWNIPVSKRVLKQVVQVILKFSYHHSTILVVVFDIIMPKVVECVPNFSEGRDPKVFSYFFQSKAFLSRML